MKLLSAEACSGMIVMAVAFVALAQSNKPIVDRFAGTWVENEAKRKGPPGAPDLRFRSTTAGKLEELRGPEVRPVVQPVNFGGNKYPLADSKNSIAWKQIDPKRFERALFSASGQLLYTRRIQISQDGKTLTEEMEGKLADGTSSKRTASFERSSGDPNGLAGVWKIKSLRSSKPARIIYEAVGNNALRVIDERAASSNYVMTLDSKPAPVTGEAVIPNMMVAAKQVNDNTIEATNSREGTVSGKQTLALSANGRTLTITMTTITTAGNREPTVRVFEKQ
jgi:hypothetical protein